MIIPPLATADTPQTLPTDWSIKAFYSFAVAQNIITTGLMAFRIWRTSSESAKYYKIENTLLPIIRVLIESAALQLIVETLTLGLYAGGLNAVLLPQGLVTPIVVSPLVNHHDEMALRVSVAPGYNVQCHSHSYQASYDQELHHPLEG